MLLPIVETPESKNASPAPYACSVLTKITRNAHEADVVGHYSPDVRLDLITKPVNELPKPYN